MNKLILSMSLALLCTNSIAAVAYTYKTNDGTTIFTNKKIKDKTADLINVRLNTPTQAGSSSGEYQFETDYKNWVKTGKATPPLLVPRKISKEIGFTGYILFSIYSGKGLISSTPYNTGDTYDSYDDCMDIKEDQLRDFKKSDLDKPNPNYIYPRNIQKTYQYKCISEVSEIERSVFSPSTLKKWEKEALAEKQKQDLQNKKDIQDYKQAKQEIKANKDKIQPESVETDISTNQITNKPEIPHQEKIHPTMKIKEMIVD